MMGCSESGDNGESSNADVPSPDPSCLPPLLPKATKSAQNFSSSPILVKISALMLFSLSDLEGVAAAPSVSDI